MPHISILAFLALLAGGHDTDRTNGTEVWLLPAPASNILDMARYPDRWKNARERVDVFGFYSQDVFDYPNDPGGFICPVEACGDNTQQAFLNVVPGGMFRWLNEQGIKIYVYGGAVKPHACTEAEVLQQADSMIVILDAIARSGAHASYVALDEPLASSMPSGDPRFGKEHRGCDLSGEQTARSVAAYMRRVTAAYPDVRVGLVEPYPAFSTDELISFLLEFDSLGVQLPFFHVDMHLQRAVRTSADTGSDLRRMREFCRVRGIPYGVIVFGEDGRSNEGFAEDAWATLRTITASVGVTEHTLLESWAEAEPGNLTSRKSCPDTIPDSDPASLTGILLRMLDYLRIGIAQ